MERWDADVSSFVGHDVLVIGVDSAAEAPGWLAFGRPRPMSRALWWFDRGLNQVGLALRLLVFASVGVVLALAHSRRGANRPVEPVANAAEATSPARAPRVGTRKRRG